MGSLIYLGIDPGRQGAVAALSGTSILDSRKLPFTGKDLDLHTLTAWLEALCDRHGCSVDSVVVAVEALGSRPSPRMGAVSAITMGKNWGRLDGWLVGLGCRYDVVRPRKWQSVICPGSTDPKVRSIAAARRLFPALDLTPGRKVKPDDNLADAAGLAEYARRTLGG